MSFGRVPDPGFRAQSFREAAQKHVVHLQGEVLPLSTYTIPGQAGWEVLAAAFAVEPIPPTLCGSLGAEAVEGRD